MGESRALEGALGFHMAGLSKVVQLPIAAWDNAPDQTGLQSRSGYLELDSGPDGAEEFLRRFPSANMFSKGLTTKQYERNS
jgi:hypothetical protein